MVHFYNTLSSNHITFKKLGCPSFQNCRGGCRLHFTRRRYQSWELRLRLRFDFLHHWTEQAALDQYSINLSKTNPVYVTLVWLAIDWQLASSSIMLVACDMKYSNTLISRSTLLHLDMHCISDQYSTSTLLFVSYSHTEKGSTSQGLVELPSPTTQVITSTRKSLKKVGQVKLLILDICWLISINILIFLSRGIRWRHAGQPITHTDIFMAPNCTTHYVLRILQTLCTNTLHIARCSICCILHQHSTAQTLHYAHCINAQYPNCTTHCTLHTSHTLNKTENPSKDALGKTDKRLDQTRLDQTRLDQTRLDGW